MLIRVEIPVDAAGIDTLLRRAFGRDDEADLVQQLREDGLLTLGVVATDDEGGVVGYAAFSPVDVAGEDRQWVALAPLAAATPGRSDRAAAAEPHHTNADKTRGGLFTERRPFCALARTRAADLPPAPT